MCLVSIVSSRVNTTCMVAIIIIALITEKHFRRMRDCEGTACLCGPGGQKGGLQRSTEGGTCSGSFGEGPGCGEAVSTVTEILR